MTLQLVSPDPEEDKKIESWLKTVASKIYASTPPVDGMTLDEQHQVAGKVQEIVVAHEPREALKRIVAIEGVPPWVATDGRGLLRPKKED